MCRIAAYLGPPIRLSRLLHEAPHGLYDQSRNARQMAGSSVAGDGWGIGWFGPEAGTAPGLLKSILPLWSDENGKTATRAIVSGSLVGHVRYASPNIETCFVNTPLYVLDDHLWTVNGELKPWPGPLSKALRDKLDPDHEADLRGATDAEMTGALWRTCFRRTGGRDASLALRLALREIRELAREHHGAVKMNILVASATEIFAMRYADSGEPNTLYYLTGEPRWHGGSVVASEPLDDGPGWQEAEPGTLVHLDGRGVRLQHIDRIDVDRQLDAIRGRAGGCDGVPEFLDRAGGVAADSEVVAVEVPDFRDRSRCRTENL
jgi:gamma-glutamyl hercynylcysteine S-oxide hydrolase